MEIKDERIGKGDEFFENLSPGDVFEFDDNFFMKTETIEYGNIEGEFYNAVDIEDGSLTTFDAHNYVTPLVIQLRIIRNG